ncbi:AAA family ATPase [Psychroserpens luteolus]|uniref:AAA family ATPase n=1 Tax=Psychroserpens luteolus TaxID=2855840 RepID=UPI001E48070A|nr:ATP-binding protein [Psychroserpens luteolus]MCD2257933.1 ATP-binding protein [Psychroserpens luteolus]
MEEKLKQIGDINSNCIKVVLYGPESTGKSSLVKELANYYDTVYVEEFSRSYAEAKALDNHELTKDDVLPIAIGQMQLENEQLKKANRLLICDTDLLETQVYSQFYYHGFCPELVKKYAFENTYDLYFLTYIDTVWEADGIRDQPHNRLQQFNRFEQALIASKKPYIVVKGGFEERLNYCKTHIDELLKKAD